MANFEILAALAIASGQPQVDVADPCQIDVRAMMELSFHDFDQAMDGGWRELSRRRGCEARAAELIRAYRELTQQRISILSWHEGQLRAGLGQREQAIQLFEQSRHDADVDPFGAAWNFYVDATIAFMRGDQEGLITARNSLAALPHPPNVEALHWPDGTPVPWPQNLDVVEGLLRCFARPYQEAYGSPECREGDPD